MHECHARVSCMSGICGSHLFSSSTGSYSWCASKLVEQPGTSHYTQRTETIDGSGNDKLSICVAIQQSWKDLTITGTSAAPSLETTWKLEDAAWSDRDYSWTNLGGFTPGNYKYMAKTGVTARTQSFTITVPTTMFFGVKIVVLSDGASPPPLTTANGWDLTCAGIDKIEGTSNYMTTSVGNLISQLPCTSVMHECHA